MRTGFRDPQYTHVILTRRRAYPFDGQVGALHRPPVCKWEVFDYCRSREIAEELCRLVNKPGNERMIVEYGALVATLMLLNGD